MAEIKPPPLSRVSRSLLPRTASWHTMAPSMDRDSMISLGNLNILHIDLCLLPLVLLLGNTEKEYHAKHVLLVGLRFPFI